MFAALPAGLTLRPVRSSDSAFLEKLHRAVREDLLLIDGEADFVESIIEMQFEAQREGYGNTHPNAMYFIIEMQHEAVGKLTVAIGQEEVRIVDIAFLPAARSKGYGEGVIRALQAVAQKTPAPLTLSAMRINPRAIALYTAMGFFPETATETHVLMKWLPKPEKIYVGG